MIVDEVHFHTMPPRHEREIWCEWLRRHSIDPTKVLVPGWIERRPERYQVAYLSAEFTEGGCMVWDREAGEPVYRTAVMQLEGPPLPFPDTSRRAVAARYGGEVVGAIHPVGEMDGSGEAPPTPGLDDPDDLVEQLDVRRDDPDHPGHHEVPRSAHGARS